MNALKKALKVLAFTVLGLVVLFIVLAIVLPGAQPANPTPTITAAQLLQNYQARVAAHDDAGARTVATTLTKKYPDSAEAQSIAAPLAELKAKMQATFLAKQAVAREAKAKADAKAAAAQAEVAVAKAARDAAEAKEKAEAATQAKKQLAGFRKHHDEVQQVTFYYAPGVPMRLGTYFGLYLVVPDDGGHPTLRWKFQYSGDDWLFVQRLVLNVDGQKVPGIDFPYGAIDRDNSAGTVWESHDEAVQGAERAAVFLRLGMANRVIVRFEGKQYYKDHVLTAGEKKGMLQMLNVYMSMTKSP